MRAEQLARLADIKPSGEIHPKGFSNTFQGTGDDYEDWFSSTEPYTDYLMSTCLLFGVGVESVIDVGAGLGQYGDYLRSQYGIKDYVGYDLDPSLESDSVKQGSLPDLYQDRKFDLVLCHSVLQYVEDLNAAFANLADLVKPDGIVSIYQTMSEEDYARSATWPDGNTVDSHAIVRPKDEYLSAAKKYFNVWGHGILRLKSCTSTLGADRMFISENRARGLLEWVSKIKSQPQAQVQAKKNENAWYLYPSDKYTWTRPTSCSKGYRISFMAYQEDSLPKVLNSSDVVGTIRIEREPFTEHHYEVSYSLASRTGTRSHMTHSKMTLYSGSFGWSDSTVNPGDEMLEYIRLMLAHQFEIKSGIKLVLDFDLEALRKILKETFRE